MKKKRKLTRVPSAIAAAFGLTLVLFELRRLQQGNGEEWFWIFVGGLMLVMGLIGVFQKPQED